MWKNLLRESSFEELGRGAQILTRPPSRPGSASGKCHASAESWLAWKRAGGSRSRKKSSMNWKAIVVGFAFNVLFVAVIFRVAKLRTVVTGQA